jgi:CheY-like chemotaxis protein
MRCQACGTEVAVPPIMPIEKPPGQLAGLRIAVVDDCEDALEVVGLMLEHEGARVDRYPTAEIALRETLIHRPDVILGDIAMPGMGGLWLMRELRKVQGYRPVAIALSAHGSNGDKIAAIAAGYAQHITKPCYQDDLIGAIKSFTGRA